MEEAFLRFPHLSEQIFQKLNNKNLNKCRKIGRVWQRYIDFENLPWHRILAENPLKNGQTALHIAAKTGQIEKFKAFLDENSNKNPKDNKGRTPFHLAAEFGHLIICKLIMTVISEMNSKGDQNITPFHLAAENGHLEVCKQMLTVITEKKS